MIHKIVNGHAPSYLNDMFEKQYGSSIYNLRASNCDFQIPKVRAKTYHDSFAVSGAMLWNFSTNSLKAEENLKI